MQWKDILKEKHCGYIIKGVLFLHDTGSPGTCNPIKTGLPGMTSNVFIRTVRTEGIGQGNSNTTVSPQSHSENSSNTNVSGVNTCNASACNVSVNNVPDNSCNGNVNALSVAVPNGCTDLNELSLPKFNNSAKQVVAHFLREIDEYFAIKKTPNELNFRFALGPLRTLLPNNGS